MIESILNNFAPTNESFLKELLKKTLNKKLLSKQILHENISLDYKDKNGDSFLNITILKNRLKSAQWLLQNGINPHLKNKNGEEAIHFTINKGADLIAKELIEKHDIDLNQVDKDKRSLLQNAVLYGEEKIVTLLIENGADVNHLDKHNRNVVFDAIANGNDSIIDTIIKAPNIDLNIKDEENQTILHKNNVISNMNLCKNLVKNGADPTICDDDGKNLLCNMALLGIDGLSLIDVAINQGYSLNTPLKNDNTLLMETLGVFYKLPKSEERRRDSLLNMASKLMEKGIDVNALNEYGENALYDAVRNNDYDTCALLINNKIDINKQNRLRQTALLLACYKGIDSLDIILLLLYNGANPNIKNELNQGLLEILNQLVLHTRKYKILSNSYILMYLNRNGKYLLIIKEILNNSKFDLRELDSKGQALFFAPLLFGDYDLFKLYISNGFDVNTLNSSGLNIFYVYVEFVFRINRYFDNFKQMLIRIIQEKVNISLVSKTGKNIFCEVINKNTNSQLYFDLIDTCTFKYDSSDKNGRTIMHHAVLNKNLSIVKMIQLKNFDVVNIADNYGILPIAYAALIDNYDIVIELLKNKHIYVKSNKTIPKAVKQKFKPMVDTIDKLKEHTLDKDELRKLTILTDQIKSDFKIKEEI